MAGLASLMGSCSSHSTNTYRLRTTYSRTGAVPAREDVTLTLRARDRYGLCTFFTVNTLKQSKNILYGYLVFYTHTRIFIITLM